VFSGTREVTWQLSAFSNAILFSNAALHNISTDVARSILPESGFFLLCSSALKAGSYVGPL